MSSENAVPQQKNNRPGVRLKRAREDKGWSVPETAEKLHVIPRYVRAIEEGEYSQLPGLVFLKGYVRSYARLVNLSEDRLIEDLEQELLVSGDPMIETSEASSEPAGFTEAGPARSKLPLILVALIVIAAGVYFVLPMIDGQGKPSTASDSGSASVDSTDASAEPDGEMASDVVADSPGTVNTAPASSETVPVQPVLQGNESEAGEPAAELLPGVQSNADPAATEIPAAEENMASDSELPATDVPSEEQLAGVEAVPADQPETIDVPAQTEVAPALPEESGVVAASGQALVRAVFSGDCWFDLRDVDNDRIVGLYRAGDSVEFAGDYPLRFVVGAVDAVNIEVDGEPLDFSNYRVRNNRVELVLER